MTTELDPSGLDGQPRFDYSTEPPGEALTEAIPVRIVETTGDLVRLAEYNHYHDDHGRFAPGGGGRLDNASIAGKVSGGLDAEGGASVSIGGSAPSDGFMVSYDSGDGHGLVLDAATKAERDAAVKDWVAKQRKFVASDPEHYFGAWKDSSDGKVYLDVSQRFKPNEKEAAIAAGKSRNQIAIFDLGSFEEIGTGGTGQ